MFRHMGRYPKYVATKSPWLTSAPAHWGTPRMKAIVSEVSDKGHPNEPLLTATQSRGVIRKDQYEIRTVEAMKSLETLKLVCVDDFVISLRSFQGGIERAHAQGIISTAYTILRADDPANRDYLTMLFKSRPFIDALRLAVTGIREGQNIEYPRLSREALPLPPADEQSAIVNYLKAAHNRLGAAISTKRRLVALLSELRQSIVNSVVLGGADREAQVATRSSPAGPIPAHWELRRFSRVATPIQRTGFESEGLLSVYLGRGVIPYSEGGKRVHAPSVDLSMYQLVEPGDLVMNNQQAWRGSVGVSELRGIVSPAYLVSELSPSLDSSYARYLFGSRSMVNQYVVASKGVGDIQRTIYWPYLRNVRVPVPPMHEQQAIVDRLEVAVSGTDKAIERVLVEIGLLEEFRIRLTADVVTGQIDVRHIATAQTLHEASEVVEDSVEWNTGEAMDDDVENV